MKDRYVKEKEIIAKRFLKLTVVQKYEALDTKQEGFSAVIELEDGYEFILSVDVMKEAYPALVKNKIQNVTEAERNSSYVIIAPYISEITAKLCEENRIGFFDYAGNCLFCKHSIYLCEKGNKNQYPKKRGQSSIFERSSEVSSLILRELFQDISRPWKLKHLAEQVGCSIGQVSKVKEFLYRNAWAEMGNDGLKIVQPEQVLREWGEIYGKKEYETYACYSLEKVPDLEEKLIQMNKQTGIEYYLTGFSGGVRYMPIVRYGRVHVYIEPQDVEEAIKFLGCKKVESGANVILIPIEEECCVKNAQHKENYQVVSPVQIYLDCIQLKGRGEEIAEAVMQKEILKIPIKL